MTSPVIFIFIKDKYWQTDFKMSSFHINQTHALILSGFFSTAVYSFKLREKLEKNMDTIQQPFKPMGTSLLILLGAGRNPGFLKFIFHETEIQGSNMI